MSDEVLIAAFAALPPTIAAVVGVIVSLKGNSAVGRVHDLVNSQRQRLESELSEVKEKLAKHLRERQ